ncbi:fructose-1,6-bisphosphatase/inositol monophosphatase family enzyme [Rhizobium halophytocola]|uniref:Fructose-1,6-bisphosphatase/inositol monophosphatase family enzyme n=2 Tax=Rhizobium halophytocola TaxID=735519 RepID=A0ABS4DZB5_9HYPH|nr:inositol monophosphatase family protein [Rhizobium halophytocola]MBP1851027.1 fructose-1,6-bisphosphatase/inositol monophosphatase family enzyme [Rhizobium halophytocola]
MAELDIALLANILQEAAATEILPRFRNLGAEDIRVKTEAIDLVTEADEAAERRIMARLAEAMPDALFIGEEGVAADPSLLDKLADADLAVVIDPIDGTFNFASGLPLFGVMASVVAKGETVAGVIYDPMGNDWLIAERGSGAWFCGADGSQTEATLAPPMPLDQMVGIANASYIPVEHRRTMLTNLAEVRLFTTYRCAAHEYRAFSGGHFHFLMYHKLMPWDHLAGALICEEAGAHVRRLDGSVYKPGQVEGGLLIAPDESSWQELRRKIFTF